MKRNNWIVIAACTAIFSGALLADGGGNGNFSASIIGSVPGLTIGGVASSSATWTISQSNVSLSSQGSQTQVQAQAQGLLIASGAGAGTTGGIRAVVATVVCGGSGGMIAANTPAAPFSAGNAQIQANVNLPAACRAPVVLLRAFNPQTLQPGAFIASTGLSSTPNNNDAALDGTVPDSR